MEIFRVNCSISSQRDDQEKTATKYAEYQWTIQSLPSVHTLAACPAVIQGIKEYFLSTRQSHVWGSEKDVAFEMIGDNATETLRQV